MKIHIGWLPRFFRRSTARSVSVDDKTLVIEGTSGTRSIPIASVEGITAHPGLIWWSLTIRTVDGATSRIGGIRHGEARAFGSVVIVHKSFPAIRNAIQSFKVLCDRETYLNYQSYQTWRQDNEASANEITFSLGQLPLPDDVKAEVGRFLALVREGPKVFAKRNDLYAGRLLTKHKDWFDTLERFPLTPRQREAIVHDEDNCLVVAGAGTGKTSTVVGKVGFVLRLGYAKPDEILLLAFTQKAIYGGFTAVLNRAFTMEDLQSIVSNAQLEYPPSPDAMTWLLRSANSDHGLRAAVGFLEKAEEIAKRKRTAAGAPLTVDALEHVKPFTLAA